MKRLIISLDLAEGTTWEQVQKSIEYNTPANTSLIVGDLTKGSAVYEIRGFGSTGFAAVVEASLPTG